MDKFKPSEILHQTAGTRGGWYVWWLGRLWGGIRPRYFLGRIRGKTKEEAVAYARKQWPKAKGNMLLVRIPEPEYAPPPPED